MNNTTKTKDSPQTLRMRSPAKVNLFLEIIRKRSDGFHDLESIFQTIPLYDTLEFTPGAESFTLETDDPAIPVNKNNLILQAAEHLRKLYPLPGGGHFHLHKVIPSAGGLGGGSSNAATALLLLNDAFKLNLFQEELTQIGAAIGSDVAFFIYGGTCLCQGRGEIVTPLSKVPALPLHIITPSWGISTPAAFAELKRDHFNRHSVDQFIEVLKNNPADLSAIYAASFNHFEEPVYSLEPRQERLHELLKQRNILARMSGSGSSIWVLGKSKESLQRIVPSNCRVII